MAGLYIDHKRCTKCRICIEVCPFLAIDEDYEISDACKLCKLCLKKCPNGSVIFDEVTRDFNKQNYQHVLVFAEIQRGQLHPVTLELIGKALELSDVLYHNVHVLVIGYQVGEIIRELKDYPLTRIVYFDDIRLKDFKLDLYSLAFIKVLNERKYNSVLVGATLIGRSLAPSVATYFKTGLTADCTALEMKENSDLVQIRPAFGGNIMAQIVTTNSRPQFATVRYKVMNACKKEYFGDQAVTKMPLDQDIDSRIKITSVLELPVISNISEAEVIVVIGNGVKADCYGMVEELASLLGGVIGYTRVMIEKGVGTYVKQIGLSGRTVKPKLIITCGVSGSVQFVAGMKGSDRIIAINSDPKANIFNVAHVGFVGFVQEIVPELICKIKEGRSV